MSGALVYESPLADDRRRDLLYDGEIFFYTPKSSTLGFCQFARKMCSEAFHPHDPETAQHALPVERYAAILAELKPRFIHHPESKRWIGQILDAFGCDPEKTYFDVPRLRTSTSDGYLTSGIAYAFPPHRDTWYSAPPCQLNWWLPITELSTDNGIALHTRYWREPVKNGSGAYDYHRWNRESRHSAAAHIKSDTRLQPHPEEPLELESQLRPVGPPGSVIIFSGAHLHSSVANVSGRTRLSIDFRTVHIDDVAAHRGAPNIDSACTGTSMRDFLRRSDLAQISEEFVAPYDKQPSSPGAGTSAHQAHP